MEKVCKECLSSKNLSEFYAHPQWVLWTLSRCKECIKAWRKSDRERAMARVSDNRRFIENPGRRTYLANRSKIDRKNNKDKLQARQLAKRSAKKNPEMIPKVCPITWWPVEHLHHIDYLKPYRVIPCSTLWHGMLHRDNPITINPEWIIDLPETRNRKTKHSLYELSF